MKYAVKDSNNNITYVETSDRKKCLTYDEFKRWLSTVSTDQLIYGTDYNIPKKKNYFWVKFKIYPEYIANLTKIHDLYGRGIDVDTVRVSEYTMEIRIRAYKDWR